MYYHFLLLVVQVDFITFLLGLLTAWFMSGQFLDHGLIAVPVHQRSNARGIMEKFQQIAIAHANTIKHPSADRLLAVGVKY